MSDAETIAFIFARGGSKGVPGKNLRELAGKPLIAHAIECAKAAKSIDAVVVSTDDEEIAAAAREWGAEVPFMRPADLAEDDSPEWLAWCHAIDWLEQEQERKTGVFVCVPTTSPLRSPEDIDACVERFKQGDVDVVLTLTPAARNPYFNMVTLNDEGLASLVIQRQRQVATRQKAPEIYDITTVCYAANPDFIRNSTGLFDGRTGAVNVPQERALDIDTEWDLKIAKAIMGEKNE